MASRLKPLTALDVQRLSNTAFVGGVPGLQCVVSPGGTKSWRLFYRLPGSTKRRSMTLGRYPGVSLADARRLASEKLALASDGVDPKAERIERVQLKARTLGATAVDYLAWCRRNNARRTYDSKRSAFGVHIDGAIGARPLTAVSRREIVALLDSLDDRPAMRRQLYLYLSHFFSWCVERELTVSNPMKDVRPPKQPHARERVLTDDEIARLFEQQGTMATIARLCLLTAQRRGSVEAMRWVDLDLDRRNWTIAGSAMKSGKLHVVPLSSVALKVIGAIEPLSGAHVFGVGSDGAKPFAGSSNGMEALRRALGGPDWRLHDLRRTAVTLAQRSGCSLDAIRALTQHKSAGVIGVDARHAFSDEKRAVAEAIADAVHAARSVASNEQS